MPFTGFAASRWQPSKPIRLIVPFASGISADIIARIISEPLGRSLKQPIVVDNKAGASGIIGTEIAAKSAADGYTLLLSVDSLVGVIPNIYSKLSFDPFKDFDAVTQMTRVPYYLITTPNQPYRSLEALLDAARARPESIDYGSLGIGSGSHVRMEFLNNLAKTKMNHIPYKSSPVPELLSGLIAVIMEPATTAIPLIKSGKVKALAVTSKQRTIALPNVPTVNEFVGPYDADGWHGLYYPANTPAEVVSRVSEEVINILKTSEIQQKFSDLGIEAVGSTPAEFDIFGNDEYRKWQKIAKSNNIKVD